MPKKLTDQKYCSWCGTHVEYKTKYVSICPACNYHNYINYKPCVSVIIAKDGELLMVKRAIEPQLGSFDLPGGFMDMTDHSIEETVYRETSEELGLDKEAIKNLTYIGSGISPYIWKNVELQNVCFYFSCDIDETTPIMLDQSENSEFNWIAEANIANIDFAWEIDRQMLAKYFNKKG